MIVVGVDASDASREALRSALDEARLRGVDQVVGGSLEIELERVTVQGPAAKVLVEAAAEAELFVVGARGHGGFAGLLLGSVSQQCAQQARSPVVIVRRSARDAEER